MSVDVTWLGHNCWSIRSGKHTILIDPFLSESPTAPKRPEEVAADVILISHGHGDHTGDVVAIAERTGAAVVTNYEISLWLAEKGVRKCVGGNLGGWSKHAFGDVQLTLAHHSSVLPDGTYGGNPGGFLLTLADAKIYFACDTALFSDMKQIGAVGLDLAVLPIGDRFTMGPEDSIEAIKLLNPRRVAPAHYNTWPPIAQDAQAWAARVRSETKAEPIVVEPGGTFTL